MIDIANRLLEDTPNQEREAYNQAVSDILSIIESDKQLETTTPSGFKVLYKVTLINTIKKLKK